MAKKKGEEQGGENRNGDGGEPDFSDPEDFVDDITDEELVGDVLRARPKETDGIENVIVVDGLPAVEGERVDKLKGVVKKIFGKFGNVSTDFYATNLPEGQTTSYMFIEYSDPNSAAEAVKTMDGYKFDKNHTLMVNLFTDFEKFENITEDWKTPEPMVYKDPGNLWYHLMEPDAFDQYLIIKIGIPKGGHGGPIQPANDIQVYLNSRPDPTELLTRLGGTDTIAKWSPLGTYLATFHSKGVAVWGGEKFDKINRFAHVNAEFIDFSPNERYLVTFAPKAERQYDNPEVLIIWEIRTGAKKRTFSEVYKTPWPIIRWSHDDKYFARMGPDTLSVYETPSFRLLENKSLKVTGIRDFSWSPTDSVIGYWVAENKDVPARVVLIEIPARTEIRAKNLFNVADCRMHWQKSGDYLCVKVDRYSKVIKKDLNAKYSGMYYNFEVFHLREKQVPVDSVEIKEPIIAFAWEPIGSKFAIIHGEQNNVTTTFWEVRKGDAPSILKRFEKRRLNSIFWAPQGQFVVLALLKSAEGPVDFIDTSDFSIMATAVPDMTTDIEWDPTGRYVIAAVSAWSGKMSDTGYTLYNFQGRVLRKERVDRFGNLFWRPRPPCLLTHQQIKNIKKVLKNYSPKFEKEDRLRLNQADREKNEKLQEKLDVWKTYRIKKDEQFKVQKPRRMLLRNNNDTDELDADKSQLQEEVIEILIKEDSQPTEE